MVEIVLVVFKEYIFITLINTIFLMLLIFYNYIIKLTKLISRKSMSLSSVTLKRTDGVSVAGRATQHSKFVVNEDD
jgi:hypothetical protein